MTARKMNKGKKGTTKSSQTAAAATPPELSRLDSGDDASDGDDESSVSVYDSGSEEEYDSNDDDVARGDEEESDDDEDDNEEDEFEDQGSSDEDEDLLEKQANESDDDDDECEVLENVGEAYDIDAPRVWKSNATSKRSAGGKSKTMASTGTPENPNNDETAAWMNTDDLSSDDEDGEGKFNRIGKVPLHWYDEYDHLGYNAHGKQVAKPAAKDLLTQALEQQEDMANKKYVVQDALNGVDVTLTPRQLEIIRRVQSGAYAHPEFEGNAEFIDYYSSVKEISGINTDRHEPKNRFQPSKYEKLQVRRLLHRLERGAITMDFLTGKVRDMNDHIKKKKNIQDESKAFMLWKGDEEDELAFRKGPEHIPAPKVPPPGHAESYRPPDEYLPTEEDLEKWSEMDPKDRPHGLLIPQKFDNLRSLGAYEHSVRERFERCLDLYLCPRMMKRRLNIDPESLVPSLPKPNDLRPFPTAQCIKYETPTDSDSPPMIRAISVSPDGQFMVSGATDGFVRMWEVQTGRLLRSWNLSKAASELQGVGSSTEKDATENGGDGEDDESTPTKIEPVVCLQWNPNRTHHILLAACGKCAFIIGTGTGGADDAELTDALLSNCASGKSGITNPKTQQAVKWVSLKKGSKDTTNNETPLSAFGMTSGLVAATVMTRTVVSSSWHKKGDYFVTVSPKAAAAAVLIHQLSKASSQQPFRKAKGETQAACFHPTKPFLFVASQQHIRVYHLVKQTMVKRLISGCRWISSLDVHPSGDHIIAGSLDRRMAWFDLDLSSTPYKTLKYHERGLRSVGFHPRYPLMASASDDGTVHVFHSMVYSDLMRNPLVVPVKILRGHQIVNKLGVLSMCFHPTQPWLFSAGADGQILLYQDI